MDKIAHDTVVSVEDATFQHVRLMSTRLNDRIRMNAQRMQITPFKALFRTWKKSFYSKSAFINGELAAIWGCAGNIMGEVGRPWLIVSPLVEDYPFRVAFMYRKELQRMQEMFPTLEDFVDEDYTESVRMLQLMGFTMEDSVQFGCTTMRRAVRRG